MFETDIPRLKHNGIKRICHKVLSYFSNEEYEEEVENELEKLTY